MFSGTSFSSIFLALSGLILISSACFASSPYGLVHSVPVTAILGGIEEAKYNVNPWGSKTERFVLEGSSGGNSSLILAAERTRRKDPLDNLEYYTGGWNISNKHYFASAGFTAAPLLVVAAIWFLGVGLCLLLTCLCFCCCSRGRSYGYSLTAYALSLILLSLFTIAAITGSIVLYTGQGKFHDSTTELLKYVVGQSDTTVSNLRNVSDYLVASKQVEIDNIFLPTDVQKHIDQVDAKINSAANTLESETEKNRNRIVDILETV